MLIKNNFKKPVRSKFKKRSIIEYYVTLQKLFKDKLKVMPKTTSPTISFIKSIVRLMKHIARFMRNYFWADGIFRKKNKFDLVKIWLKVYCYHFCPLYKIQTDDAYDVFIASLPFILPKKK